MYKKMRKTTIAILLFVFSVPALAKGIINVKDFGAKADGINDDTKAIQAAINHAVPGLATTIYFPKGIYNIASFTATPNYLRNFCIAVHSNIYIKGDGDETTIRLADHLFDKQDTSANAHLFFCKAAENVRFSDLLIDMNGSNNLVPENVIKNFSAIFAYNGKNFIIKNVTIKNCAGTNMIDFQHEGTNFLIENCRFINGGNYVGNPTANKGQIDFSFIYSEWGHTIIQNNFIQQQNIDIALQNYTAGIELHGSGSSATGNYIQGCWPAMYVTSILKPLNNINIENNTMADCLSGVIFFVNHVIKNVKIENNTIHLTWPRNSILDFCTGIRVPNGNSKDYTKELANLSPVYNIQIIGNTISADSMQTLTMGMLLHSMHASVISDNLIKQMNYGGIVLQGSKWGTDSLLVEKNIFFDFRPNYHPTAIGGYVIITDTYSSSQANAISFKNVIFKKNRFMGNVLNVKEDKNFSAVYIALPKDAKNDIEFKENYFSNKNESLRRVETE